MPGAVHLVARFFGSLAPIGPRASDTDWVRAVLSPAEFELWSEMSRPDRRHSAAVARRVNSALGDAVQPDVIAAALLHDIGKLDARLGTFGRVVATVCGLVSRDMAEQWASTRGFTRRVGLYLCHDRLGSERLAYIGSAPIVVAWARDHHQSPSSWTIDRTLADVLKAADGD
jgi:hypothetical protein